MNYKLLLACFIFLIFNAISAYSQEYTLLGYVLDKYDSSPISGVEISTNNIKNKITTTDSTGFYTINNFKIDSSLFIFFNHQSYSIDSIEICSKPSDNNIISTLIFLESLSKQDTNKVKALEKTSVIYNVDEQKLAFYSDVLNLNENSTIGDYIAGLPLVVKIDDKFIYLGEEIEAFSIDGNTFFSNNNDLILKNIPAFFIDKAEVSESTSTRSRLTNFDDGNTSKSISIYSKEKYENSLFGTMYAGISNIERWNTGGNINFFNNDRLFSIMYQTNNINAKNFTPLSLTNLEGASNMTNFDDRSTQEINTKFSNFFNSINDFVIDQSNGLNENIIFGTSYFDTFDKWTFHGEYFFDKTDNQTQAQFKRIYFGTNADSLTYFENSKSESRNLTHRFKVGSTYKFDELQQISIGSSTFIQNIKGNSNILGQYLNPVSERLDTLGSARNINNVNANAYKISIPITYKKKFRSNNERTLLATLTSNYYSENRTGLLNSQYFIAFGPRLIDNVNDFYLQNNINSSTINLDGEVAYTEPIAKNFRLLFSWKFNLEKNDYDIITDTLYSTRFFTKDTLSLKMKQNYTSNNIGIFYLFKWKNIKITHGLYLQNMTFNTNITHPNDLSTNAPAYNYFLPAIFIHYYVNENNHVKIGYEKSSVIPSIQSTRDVLFVMNPLNLQHGNMFLEPSTFDYASADYLYANKSGTSFFQAHFSASFISNYISTVTQQKSSGSLIDNFSGYKIIGFENMNNFYSTNSFLNYNTRVSSIKSSLDIFTQHIYNNVPSSFNQQNYFTKENKNLLGVSLKSEISKNLNFVLASSTSYHRVKTTLSTNNPTKYLVQGISLTFNSLFFKRLFISTDIDNKLNLGLSNDYENSKYTVWNASLGYRMLEDKSMEFRIAVHDILNQNMNINYSVTNLYVEELITNNLKRYFMFSIIYHIKIPNIKYTE
jgi:hypothetical protein